MSQTFARAQTKEQRVRPAFTVEKLEGTRTVVQHIFNPKLRKIQTKEVDVPAGYMVRCAKGHSVRVDEDGLKRIMDGDDTVELVDMETGETKGLVSALVA